jgi:hypothetical protein
MNKVDKACLLINAGLIGFNATVGFTEGIAFNILIIVFIVTTDMWKKAKKKENKCPYCTKPCNNDYCAWRENE